jgi:Tol biopolymer transport system component
VGSAKSKRIIMKINHFLYLFFITNHLLAQSDPPKKPELFMQGIVSTGLNERDLAISPDGSQIYFTVVAPLNSFSSIFYIEKQQDAKWSKPKNASFSGKYSDLEPAFSPDGKRLYFVSKRPVDGIEKKDFDIWYVEKQLNGWSEPKYLDINTTFDEFYPSIAKNGNLYFTASYNEAETKEDIFMAQYKDGKYQKPIPLDSAINTNQYEFNAYIAPDESYLLFTAYGRVGDKGRGDIYISTKKEGKWQSSKPISAINSDRLDYCPMISFDGKTLFFTSERHQLLKIQNEKKVKYSDFQQLTTNPLNGNGDIYWVDFSEIIREIQKN